MIWIWLDNQKERCAEFQTEFTYNGGSAILKIAAKDKFAVYINGEFVYHGRGIHDVPKHKTVTSVDVQKHLKTGVNTLRVESAFVHVEDEAFPMPSAVAFELLEDDKIIAKSCEKTLCRKGSYFSAGGVVTGMLGVGLAYDFTSQGDEWKESTVVESGCVEEKRRIPLLSTGKPLPSIISAQGIFAWRDGEKLGEKMQRAWLSSKRFAEMTSKNRTVYADLHEPIAFNAKGGDGVFVLADVGFETAGVISFCVTVDKACKAYIGWGEHLSDLRVRTEIDDRNFAQEFTLKAGKNEFDGYLERVGCRYLCLYVETESVEVERLTIREVNYPFNYPKKDFGDRLLNKIYETGRRTLDLCAHEYYEDCPWREQGHYADGRYQMLFGYSAFEEYDYPRESLRLMAYASRLDGFVELRSPMANPFTIPAHTAHWLLAVCENAEVDYNEEFIKEMLPYAEKMLAAYQRRTNDIGITVFSEKEYWNWHDWTKGLEGGDELFMRTEPLPADGDGILTVFICKAAKEYAELERKVGNIEKANELAEYAKDLAAKLENFYDEKTGLYASYVRQETGKEGYHAYMQALVGLAIDLPKDRAERICSALKNPRGIMEDVGFGTLVWKYETIIRYTGDIAWCVDDICKRCGDMLFSGATSYWETPLGEADFDDAGSLCHAWTSVACYIFDKYLPQAK